MSLEELFEWTQSKDSLMKLEEVLKCHICQKIFENPQRFSGCGHLVCKTCITDNVNICPICDIPSCVSDITSDHIFKNIIAGYGLISKLLITKRSSEEGIKEDVPSPGQAEVCGDNNIVHPKNSEVNSIQKQSIGVRNSGRNSKRSGSGRRKTRSCDRKPAESKKIIDTEVIDLLSDDDCKQNKKQSLSAKRSLPANKDENKEDQPSGQPKHRLSKDLMKRNKKGETPLHVACIKGDRKKIEELLEAGASPCTKDNAGWTPLHEAVSKGYKEIVELLLENGAFVNTPGLYNNTPLHDAVLHQRSDIILLLLSYGADPDVCNIEGNSARNLAETDEIIKLLNKKPAVRKSSSVYLKPISFEDPVLLGCGLEPENYKMLTKFAQKFKLKLVNNFNSDVNHVIVEANDNQCSPSVPVLHAILRGKWIVNTSWLYQCLHQNELVDPTEFEVKGTTNHPNSEGPRKGRTNAEQLLPSIFNGCFFYLANGKYSVDQSVFLKHDLTALIRSGDGVTLTREPNPEAIPPMECTVPFHAHGTGPFASCSHYIIYQPGKGEPQLKYNMTHVKSLSATWLVHCIETFSLVNQ